jgi:hypothetical protein
VPGDEFSCERFQLLFGAAIVLVALLRVTKGLDREANCAAGRALCLAISSMARKARSGSCAISLSTGKSMGRTRSMSRVHGRTPNQERPLLVEAHNGGGQVLAQRVGNQLGASSRP